MARFPYFPHDDGDYYVITRTTYLPYGTRKVKIMIFAIISRAGARFYEPSETPRDEGAPMRKIRSGAEDSLFTRSQPVPSVPQTNPVLLIMSAKLRRTPTGRINYLRAFNCALLRGMSSPLCLRRLFLSFSLSFCTRGIEAVNFEQMVIVSAASMIARHC